MKNTVLFPMSNLVCDIADPAKEVCAITADALKAYDIVETREAIRKISDTVYSTVSALASYRESCGLKGVDDAILTELEKNARKALNAWFRMLGKRDPAKRGGPERPLYSATVADLVLMGEVSADARNAAKDVKGISGEFERLLVMESARILNGKPLARITASELKASCSAAKTKAAAKAAKTKEANKVKEAEAEQAKATAEKELADAKETAEKLTKVLNNADSIVAELVSAIIASHATSEEKQKMLALANSITKA